MEQDERSNARLNRCQGRTLAQFHRRNDVLLTCHNRHFAICAFEDRFVSNIDIVTDRNDLWMAFNDNV